mmetsp:Transcript_40928/g.52709  ORF Transcript_40928/g.52709 Transcript_40928/m.52709 type:complete len:497 (+) Transcript_40928:275-1765(+)
MLKSLLAMIGIQENLEEKMSKEFVSSPTEDVRVHYRVLKKELGRGSCGVVRKCIHRETEEVFAIKTILKEKVRSLECLRKEIAILKGLDHPNILKLKEVYEDEKFIHLITPRCSGGELFTKIMERLDLNNCTFTEKEVLKMARTMLEAIAYCHAHGVTHRDLKPENFMFESNSPDAELKLIDFGLSNFMTSCDNYRFMETRVGTVYYIAPEVLQRNYTHKCDVWSIGVILYVLFCGYAPFDGDSDNEIYSKIMTDDLHFPVREWGSVSTEAKLLITSLLEKDTEKRPTAEQALAHRWFSACNRRRLSFTFTKAKFMRDRLSQYLAMNRLQKECMGYIVQQVDEKEVNYLKNLFEEFDDNGDGKVTVDELRWALVKNGFEKEFRSLALDSDRIVNGLDLDGDEKIDCQEFLAAVIDRNLCTSEEILLRTFRSLNGAKSAHISAQDILGLFPTLEDAQAVIDDFDKDKNGFLEFDEFKSMMDSCFWLYTIDCEGKVFK